MDAVEFLNEWKRMCKSFDVCEDCVGEKYCYNPKETTHDCSNNWRKLVPIVDAWSKEHPKKTRLQDFLGKYPNAPLKIGTRIPKACALELGYCDSCKHVNSSCVTCWNEPVE